MTDAETVRESWRLHFWRLLQEGATLQEGQSVAEFLGDDEEFEKFLREVEDESEERRLQSEVESTEWEPVE
jgi:hypothetical protein